MFPGVFGKTIFPISYLNRSKMEEQYLQSITVKYFNSNLRILFWYFPIKLLVGLLYPQIDGRFFIFKMVDWNLIVEVFECIVSSIGFIRATYFKLWQRPLKCNPACSKSVTPSPRPAAQPPRSAVPPRCSAVWPAVWSAVWPAAGPVVGPRSAVFLYKSNSLGN